MQTLANCCKRTPYHGGFPKWCFTCGSELVKRPNRLQHHDPDMHLNHTHLPRFLDNRGKTRQILPSGLRLFLLLFLLCLALGSFFGAGLFSLLPLLRLLQLLGLCLLLLLFLLCLALGRFLCASLLGFLLLFGSFLGLRFSLGLPDSDRAEAEATRSQEEARKHDKSTGP